MNLTKKLVLLVCSLSLSACATAPVPNGKLDPKYNEYVTLPADVEITELQLDKPLKIKVPVTNVTASGHPVVALAALAISVGSTAASHAIRADEKKAIMESITDKSMYDIPGKKYAKTIKSADWLRVTEVMQATDMDNKKWKEFQAAQKEHVKEMEDGQCVALVSSKFEIGEQFENLTQTFALHIFAIKDGKQEKKIYTVILSDVFYPEESMDTGFENHTLWIENNNAIIKKAIKETTKNINEQLKAHLDSPYPAPEEEEGTEEQPDDA